MTYSSRIDKGKQWRKQYLPLRKYLLPLLLALPGSPASTAADSHGAAIEPLIEQQLVAEARARLAARARQLHWGPYQAEVSVWLPGSTDRLGPCLGSLEVEPSRSDAAPWGRLAYTVGCAEPGWRLRARVEVRVWMEVWTARHEIARNRKLEAGDLVRVRTDISELHGGFATDRRQLIGYRTERSIRAGQAISPGLLAAQVLVNKDDHVVIRAHADGLTASTRGTALGDGALHQEVKVRNHSSGKVISTWVVERGVVETRF